MCRWRGIELRQLGGVGRLERGVPSIEVGAADRLAVPGRLRVPGLDASPELIDGHIEEVQLDANAKGTSRGSELVAFRSRPDPEVENDADAKAQEFLGQAPELGFDFHPSCLVPRRGAEGPQPLVLGETHGAPFGGELRCQHRLSRAGQPAREDQPGVSHGGSSAASLLSRSRRRA